MPIFSLKCFRTDTQVARNRVRGFGLLKPRTVPARIVSPLSVAFSTLSAFQIESVEQPWLWITVPTGSEPRHGWGSPSNQRWSLLLRYLIRIHQFSKLIDRLQRLLALSVDVDFCVLYCLLCPRIGFMAVRYFCSL